VIVSVDLPEDVVEKIEDAMDASKPPRWPFKAHSVIRAELNPVEQTAYDEYWAAKLEFDKNKRNPRAPNSRSGVLRKIVYEYFGRPLIEPEGPNPLLPPRPTTAPPDRPSTRQPAPGKY
jgi:hypothetical protein